MKFVNSRNLRSHQILSVSLLDTLPCEISGSFDEQWQVLSTSNIKQIKKTHSREGAFTNDLPKYKVTWLFLDFECSSLILHNFYYLKT